MEIEQYISEKLFSPVIVFSFCLVFFYTFLFIFFLFAHIIYLFIYLLRILIDILLIAFHFKKKTENFSFAIWNFIIENIKNIVFILKERNNIYHFNKYVWVLQVAADVDFNVFDWREMISIWTYFQIHKRLWFFFLSS